MKKTMKIVLAVLLALALVLCCTACGNKTQTEFKPDGKVNGELKLGFDATYPPYGYLDEETNQYAGFDIDCAKAVCKELGYTLKLVPIEWDAKDMELESGNIDCIWNGFTINGREDLYTWSVPYVDNSIVVMTLKDAGIAALADLAGKTVTVQADSSGEAALKENTDLVASLKDGKYLTCADYTTAYQELKAGAIDAIVIDIGVANYFAGEESVILEEAVSTEQYGIGFLKGNTELCKLIESTFLKLAEETDTISKLAEKYGIADAVTVG